jgi:hypothetical protein
MPSNVEPLNDSEIEAYEAGRDLAADLLQAIQEMKTGQGHVVWPLLMPTGLWTKTRFFPTPSRLS